MPSPSKPPPLSAVVRGSVAYAARAREHLRAGLSDARVASLQPPRADEHLRRFFFGLALPLTMMRVAWANREIRASVVRRLIPPLLLVGLIATVGIMDIVGTLVRTRHDPTALALQIEDGRKSHKNRDDDEDEDDKKDEVNGEAIAQAAKDAKEKGGSVFDISAAAIEATQAQMATASANASAAKASAPPSPPPPSGIAAALHVAWEFLTSKVAKLIATLSIVEWILVWIGREHQDQIAYSVLTGVPGEPLPRPPRLRFDLAWLKMKGWRTLRLLIFLALAAPVMWLVGMIPRVGGSLALVVEAVWATYWACVFAIANTFLVWEQPAPPDRAPWFMRVLRTLARIPLLGIPFRIYAGVLRVATRKVWPACLAFENAPWESAGLALARAIASVPVVYIVTRPAFTPAATHAFVARTSATGIEVTPVEA